MDEKKLNKKDKKNKEKNPRGKPLLYKTVEELDIKIAEYFKSCWDYKRDMFGNRIKDREQITEAKGDKIAKVKDHGYIMEQVKPYTIVALANFLGMAPKTIIEYSKKEKYRKSYKKALAKCEEYAVERLFTGGGHVAGIIFNLKNNYGWKDKIEIDTRQHHTFDEYEDATDQEIAEMVLQKYGKRPTFN